MVDTVSPYRKLRILILTYESHVPPSSLKGIDLKTVDWKMEYDVISTLLRMGQDVKVLGIHSDLRVIRDTVEQWDPHVVFNLLDEFDGEAIFDQNVVSYLELLRTPYTGCNPRGLILSRDKSLAKKLLTYHRIPVPQFAVFPKNRRIRRPKNLRFPLFVKSLTEEASLGISQSSIVNDDEKLLERVKFIHSHVGTDALVESYIEGRELYVGVVGNNRIQVYPTWELKFRNAPDEIPRIATRKVKWDLNYRKKYGITTGKAANLSEELHAKIQHMCKRVYKILGMNGYARMDLRLTPKQEIYFLEANPNPHIGYGEDLAESAEKAGLKYKDFLWRILNLGLKWETTEVRPAAIDLR